MPNSPPSRLINTGSLLGLVAGTHDFLEGVLEGGTANKESIDVGSHDQVSSILVSDGATVEDAGLLGGLGGHILSKPASNAVVGLLGLLWGGSHAGADGPDGLVGDHDVAPVIDLLADSVKLSGVDDIGLTTLALIELLADARHNGKTVLGGNLNLVGNDLVALAEDMASLAVPQDDPVKTEVLDHLRGGLTSVGTVSVEGAVLGGELNLGAGESLLSLAQVQEAGSADNLDLALVEGHRLEDLGGELTAEVNAAVALPVSADEQFAKGHDFVCCFE